MWFVILAIVVIVAIFALPYTGRVFSDEDWIYDYPPSDEEYPPEDFIISETPVKSKQRKIKLDTAKPVLSRVHWRKKRNKK